MTRPYGSKNGKPKAGHDGNPTNPSVFTRTITKINQSKALVLTKQLNGWKVVQVTILEETDDFVKLKIHGLIKDYNDD